ncbi:hypothetical protein C8R44DRAFT_875613 [Mycena epipterygia]|nr:hypothetical protein C8R44DRAFT_875613 [Mycena epipterygia]
MSTNPSLSAISGQAQEDGAEDIEMVTTLWRLLPTLAPLVLVGSHESVGSAVIEPEVVEECARSIKAGSGPTLITAATPSEDERSDILKVVEDCARSEEAIEVLSYGAFMAAIPSEHEESDVLKVIEDCAKSEGAAEALSSATMEPTIPINHKGSGVTEVLESSSRDGRLAPFSMFKPQKKVGAAPSILSSLRILLLASPLNVLLVFIPIMFCVRFIQGNTGSEVFAFAFLALLPTAKIFGPAMEDLTLRVDPHSGRFIRVLAGNTIELISGIIAIIQCQLGLLQASLVGSILINILLVLGVAFFSGGIVYSENGFAASPTNLTSSLLMLGAIATLLPSIFTALLGDATGVDVEHARISILRISRGISLILLFCYIMFLLFMFWSHLSLFVEESGGLLRSTKYSPREKNSKGDIATSTSLWQDIEAGASHSDTDEEHSDPKMSLPLLVLVAVVACVLITVVSEYLISSLSNLTFKTSLTPQWVGLILIPLAGTFARHDLIEALTYGRKDKMTDSLACGVLFEYYMFALIILDVRNSLSTGSSLNLSLCVQPFLVLLGWAMHKNLTLSYDPFESFTLFLSVYLVNHSLQTGKSAWIYGMILIALYFLIAISFWFYKGPKIANGLISAC